MPPCPATSEAVMYSQRAHLHRAQIYSTLYTQLATQINADEKIHHSHRREQHQNIAVFPFLIIYLHVCVCTHMSICSWWIPPAAELSQSALEFQSLHLHLDIHLPQGLQSHPGAGTDHYTHTKTQMQTDILITRSLQQFSGTPWMLWKPASAVIIPPETHRLTPRSLYLLNWLIWLIFKTNHTLTTALVPVVTSVPWSDSICWNSSLLKHIHIESRYPHIGKS